MAPSRRARVPRISETIASWTDDLAPLRPVFDQAVRQAGFVPCLPDGARLEELIAGAGGVERLAERCASDPLARLGLLDLVPRACAGEWSADRTVFADFETRALPRLTGRQRASTPPALRVWCMAACRGEPAWRAALALHRALPERDRWDAAVLATDFSLGVLASAQSGLFGAAPAGPSGEERRHLLAKSRGGWAVRPELRRLVHFAWLDPAGDWPVLGAFEAIFTGDLLRLLSQPTRAELVSRIAKLLRRRGVLYTAEDDDFPELNRHFPRVRAPGIRSR